MPLFYHSFVPTWIFCQQLQDDMRFPHNDWTHFRRQISMFLEVNRGTKEKAGERTGAFVAPVRSQLPAVRAVAGF